LGRDPLTRYSRSRRTRPNAHPAQATPAVAGRPVPRPPRQPGERERRRERGWRGEQGAGPAPRRAPKTSATRAPMVPPALVLASAAAAVLTWSLALRRLLRVAVEGESMAPVLRDGDHLVIWRSRQVRPGDIVAAADPRDPGRTLVKRAQAVGPEGIWLAGDNPAQSTDSRHFGPVPLSSVKGRAVYRYVPLALAGSVPRAPAQ